MGRELAVSYLLQHLALLLGRQRGNGCIRQELATRVSGLRRATLHSGCGTDRLPNNYLQPVHLKTCALPSR
jgi:hypothetical protein